jgi:two-component system response regulator YesN
MRIMVDNPDFAPLLDAAEHYTKATGIDCVVIDFEGNRVSSDQSSSLCRFCHHLQATRTIGINCDESHLYGSYQAERFGGKYIYLCPLNLMHWVSPVSDQGMMKGALVCGPTLVFDPEDFIERELIANHHLDKAAVDRYRQALGAVPRLAPDRANSLAELLLVVAAFLSNKTSSETREDQAFVAQQSRVSEYIHSIKTMEGDERPGTEYPFEKERKLIDQISSSDTEGAQETLNEIMGTVFFSSGRNFDVVKSRVLELVVLLSRAAMAGGADAEQVFGLNYQYLNQIHHFRSVDELAFWLSKIIRRFTDLVFKLRNAKHADVILKIYRLVDRRYSEKLSLDEAAAEVYLSPAYFSKVFKEETGLSFTQYVNKVRVDKSKEFLADGSLSLVEVAGLVGFEDQSYFTKVFKRVTGLSPGRYRGSGGIHTGDAGEIHD